MKIRISANGKSIIATLADNSTARDFTSLLPITLTMHDLFGREKAAGLPRAISTAGPRSSTYAVGEVILWSPGPDIAVFYRHDGKTIPSPGSILIAKVDQGVEMFDIPGRIEVTFELVGE
ncbi:cyclophilin-like fold protein [Pseudomonas izuensis]|uniref:cyclophilin-like fold protein n=1 Tax=Pseudomonas izuensis TaxID=2684212 RepID=UPI001C499879|nr:cyclophilin-like fold protein [Pseudomonas izuensis]